MPCMPAVVTALKLSAPLLTGLLYSVGGQKRKYVRRFMAPVPVVLLCLCLGRNSLCVAIYPLLSLSYHIGYGHRSRLMRLLNNKTAVRTVCGLLYGMSAVPIVLLTKNMALFNTHILLAATASAVLGTQTVRLHATAEEGLIGVSSVLLLPWL